MGKYIIILKTSLIEKMQYVGNMIGRAFFYAVIIFMLLQLWKFMYGNTSGDIGGYSFNQMIWYVIMTELIWFSVRSNFIRREISNDIKSGKIAYTLNKPYNYIFYVMSKYLGETIINYGFNAVVAVLLGMVMAGELQSFNFFALPFILITFAFATFISAFIYIIISLTSFWFEENAPFIWIYEKLVLLVGIIFPVEIFPAWAQTLIKISPIYTSIYAPAKMTVDFSFSLWINITLYQIIYFSATLGIVLFAFSKGVKKLNVNGG